MPSPARTDWSARASRGAAPKRRLGTGRSPSDKAAKRARDDPVLLGLDVIADARSCSSATDPAVPSCRASNLDPVQLDETERFADDEGSHTEDHPSRRSNSAVMKRRLEIRGRACKKCHRSKTPRWRRGPSGPKTLCNVCGLIFAKRESRLLRDNWLINVSRGA